MKYFLTPEFHRNLWLRVSPFRLAAVPVVIALMVWIAFNLSTSGSLAESLMNASLTGYFFVTLVWGTYEAAAALPNEVKDKTWDFQRMSPLSPGQLAFGKLFGSTSFVWYIGAILLAIFVCSYSQYAPHIPVYQRLNRLHNPTPAVPGKWQQQGPNGAFRYVPVHPEANAPDGNFTPMPPVIGPVIAPAVVPAAPVEAPPATDTPENILFITLCLILSGLAGHAAAFLTSLSDFSAARNKLGRLYIPGNIGPFIVGFICAGSIYSTYASEHLNRYGVSHSYGAATWFGAAFDARIFVLLSILFFLGWAYLGIYRIARAELMYPQTPIGWMIAVPVIIFYMAGFLDTNDNYYLSMFPAFLFMNILLVAYISMLLEAADIEKYRRFSAYWKQKNWRKAFQNMPRWVSLLGILVLLYFYTLAVTQWPFASVLSLMTSAVLFAARDGIFVHGLYMGALPRYVRFYKGLFYLLAYGILPMLYCSITGNLQSFNIPVSPQSIHDGFTALAFFYPTALGNTLLAILPVSIEAALALIWMQRRKKKLGEAL